MPPKKRLPTAFTLTLPNARSYDCTLSLPPPGTPTKPYAVIATHGAGGDHNISSLQSLSDSLSSSGIPCLRFTCKPIHLKTRVSVFAAAVDWLRESSLELDGCIIAGRSMGSRAAMQYATENIPFSSSPSFVKGVAALAYPLHRAGGADGDLSVRTQMLTDLTVASLLISGDRDTMCSLDRFLPIHKKMKIEPVFHKLLGGDHSFKARKKDPFTTEELLTQQNEAMIAFLENLFETNEDQKEVSKRRRKSEEEGDLRSHFKKRRVVKNPED